MRDNISLDQIRTKDSYNLISLYENIDGENASIDSPFQYGTGSCEYYEPVQFRNQLGDKLLNSTHYFHINCRGLSSNLLCDLHSDNCSFDMIGVSEVYRCENDSRLSLPGYHDLLTRCREDGARGGVGLFVKDNINYIVRDNLSVFIPHVFESLFIELVSKANKHAIVGVIYRPNTAPKADIDVFSTTLHGIMNIINTEHKNGVIMGDMNVDLLKFESHNKTNDYLDTFSPVVLFR